jgi:hypothetical protein
MSQRKRAREIQSECNNSDEDPLSSHIVDEEEPIPEDKEDGTEKSKPLLKEVTIVGSATGKNPGGAKAWICNHCHKQFTSSYTRIHNHFFGPQPGKKPQIGRCQAVMKNRTLFERLKKDVEQAEKMGVSPSLKHSTITKKHIPVVNKPLQDAFGMMEREAVDMKVIRGLCANGIAFNVLRNPQFHEMISAVNRAPKGYKLPSYEKARTTLLDQCRRGVENDLAPFKDSWYTQGVSIVSDGWSNVKQEPLINVNAVNSRGAMYMYSGVFSGIEKTGVVIKDFLLTAIEEVGAANVLSVVTDNAANCKAAGREIEKVHKHIFWSPCVVHTLNLVFKDFAKSFSWLSTVYKSGKEIVKYFKNHQLVLSIFRAYSRLELLKVAKTRFASHYILLKRLLQCKEALCTVVVQRQWKEWAQCGDEKAKAMARLVANTIKDDDFWDEVENAVKITKPLYYLMKFTDGEGPKMGEIYERMDNMLGELKDIMMVNKYVDDYPTMEKIVLERWEKMNIALHCLGFALTPRFYHPRYIEIPAPGGTIRKAPNCDLDVMKGVMSAFERIANNQREAKVLRDQFAEFHMKKGLYAMPTSQFDALTMNALDWWCTYGSQTPELSELAKKVLSQPISSSSAERVWSTYSHIHNVKRNKLKCETADKLVYIHYNIRLQSRLTETYKEGPFKMWDVDPEDMERANAIDMPDVEEDD